MGTCFVLLQVFERVNTSKTIVFVWLKMGQELFLAVSRFSYQTVFCNLRFKGTPNMLLETRATSMKLAKSINSICCDRRLAPG